MGLPDGKIVATAKTNADSVPQMRAFLDELMMELRSAPGIQSAAAGFGAPFTGPAQNRTTVHIDGDAPDVVDRPSLSEWKCVTPGYIETLGIPILRGRSFTMIVRAASVL
jgi:hypothetical protein